MLIRTYRFETGDITKGALDSYTGKFDLIHARFVAVGDTQSGTERELTIPCHRLSTCLRSLLRWYNVSSLAASYCWVKVRPLPL